MDMIVTNGNTSQKLANGHSNHHYNALAWKMGSLYDNHKKTHDA
jgi:hypothetical protein